MDTKSNILPSGAGERAAMGGYLPQYDEFVYMLNKKYTTF